VTAGIERASRREEPMGSQRSEYLERLTEAAEALPTATLGMLLDFASYLRSREEWEATQELLCDSAARAVRPR
jgi:hypothetical protein